MSNNDIQNLISQLANAINKNQPTTQTPSAPNPSIQKPQMNMASIAELVQPSTRIAMDERSVIQLSSGESMNNKNRSKKNSG